eukprot:gene21074-1162_t
MCQQNQHNPNIYDVASKSVMQRKGWTFAFTNDETHLGGSCGGGWYGYSGGDAVGTLTSPALKGFGMVIVEFSNCWDAGVVRLYLNDELVEDAYPYVTKTKRLNFLHGDVVKLRDESGNSVVNLKSFTI